MPSPAPRRCAARAAVPPIQFAAGEIHRALAARGATLAEGALDGLAGDAAGTRFVLASGAAAARVAAQLGVAAPRSGVAQAYAIRVKQEPARRTYAVLAGDAAGAMYGGLDLAEAIRLGTLDACAIPTTRRYIAQRGIKFNIPLDARTPSYSDNERRGAAEHPRDVEHGFLARVPRRDGAPSLQRALAVEPAPVPVAGQGPGVSRRGARRRAAHHARRSTTRSRSTARIWCGPAMLAQLETVRTTDDRRRRSASGATSCSTRTIAASTVYVFTWNIFTFGADGKYGITPAQDNPEDHRLLPQAACAKRC